MQQFYTVGQISKESVDFRDGDPVEPSRAHGVLPVQVPGHRTQESKGYNLQPGPSWRWVRIAPTTTHSGTWAR